MNLNKKKQRKLESRVVILEHECQDLVEKKIKQEETINDLMSQISINKATQDENKPKTPPIDRPELEESIAKQRLQFNLNNLKQSSSVSNIDNLNKVTSKFPYAAYSHVSNMIFFY